MRFAFSTSPQMCTWTEVLDIWEAADLNPFWESGWTFDHFEPILGQPRSGPCLEGWITLAALLQATTRLRGGVLVTGMQYRNPAVLANMAATLDHTSGGRLEFGLGAGWNQEESDAYGIELGSIKTRMDRFAEGLEVIQKLFTEDRPSFKGEHYNLQQAYLEPKSIQKPYPPIVIGGSGEKRTLPLVAKYADHWNFGTAAKDPIAELAHKREVLDKECAKIGRDPATIMISALLFGPAMTTPQSIDLAGRYRDAGVDLLIVALPRPLNPADLDPYVEALSPLA